MKYQKTVVYNFFFWFCWISISCQRDDTVSSLSSITAEYEKHFEGKRAYLVTGLDGCGACVESTVKFIETNIDKRNFIFIISGKSKKKLKMTFTQQVIKSPNFIFDSSQIALKTKLVEAIYPRLFLISNEQLVYSTEVNYLTSDSLFHVATNFLRK